MKRTITANSKRSVINALKSVIAHRGLIATFAARDLKIHYAQTLLGILWSLIRPLTGLLIYSVFFGGLLNVDTGTIPYPLFAFSGLICWYYFAHLVGTGGTSLLASQDIVKKINFPKLILPLSKALGGLVEFTISFAVLLGLMIYWGYVPGPKILFLPLIVLLNIFAGLSIGIWLSALTVRYRDFQQIIPYLINFGIFLTPVFYPISLIPSEFQFIIFLNPMAGVVELMRWALLDGAVPNISFAYGFVLSACLMISGLYYFVKTEGRIADVL